jgi:PEGA domain
VGRLIATCFACLLALSGQAQQVSPQAEFAVLRTDRVTITTGESTHLNCSVVGLGDSAQINCESHTSGSGIPLVYHVALVVSSDKVGYIVSCGGGLVWRIGCHPLSAGQVVRGTVEGGKLHVSVGSKTKTFRVETSAYIGPFSKGSPEESTTATPPSAPSTASEPSVKLAVETKKSDASSTGAAQPEQPSSPASTAKVMVSSEPAGGDIYVDGDFMGNTPSLIELPAGSHTVRVEAKGQKSWSRAVSLTAGSKVTLQAALSAQ